jgi:hypothetical protein
MGSMDKGIVEHRPAGRGENPVQTGTKLQKAEKILLSQEMTGVSAKTPALSRVKQWPLNILP